MRPYSILMGPRKLFAILIAMAVLIAPAFSRLGEASAALPDNHHMVQGGHCQSSEPMPNEHEQAPTKNCCLSMCMGVAVATPNGVQASNRAAAAATYAIRSLHLSYLGEIATPPPKFA